MLPTMHRLDGGRSASSNNSLDLSALLSRKEKRSSKRGEKRSKRSLTHSKLKSSSIKVDSEAPEVDANVRKNPVIIATSQQSRFHTVTFDEFGKNVLLNQFTLAIGTSSPDETADPVGVVELLRDTQLKLNYGTRYGLVGPNGIGKSTLLTALADGLVEGLPTSLKILYVNQLDTSSLSPEAAHQSVLHTVLSADTRVVELQHKIDVLQAVLVESSAAEEGDKFATDKAALLHALLTVQVMEAEQAQEAASKIAIKRSGMLGRDARLRLLEAEHNTAELRKRLQFTTLSGDEEHESIAAANETDILREIHQRMEEFQQELKILDEASMEARARQILTSMGVSPAKQDAPLSSLSGGWQVRILLARVLFMEPDFLLLDEPTNHLDTPSILWLKNYLLTLDDVLGTPVTLVVVSHDRFFLNAVTEETIFFRGFDKSLAYYEGTYDSFELAMARKRQFNARLQTKLDKKTEQISAMVSKLSQQATRSKDDKKMQVAASKKKKMERIGNERSAKGTRFKLNRDRVGYFLTDRDQAEDQAKYDETDGGNSASSASRILSSDPPQIRNLTKLDNTTMISLENVSFRYDLPPDADMDKPKMPLVLEKLNLTINYGDKIVLVGRNGAGKTTFMKLVSKVLAPKGGKVEYFHGARIASLMQHNVEDLKRQEWSRGLTPLELLRTRLQTDEAASLPMPTEVVAGVSASEGKMRGHLSSFGISGSAVVAVPLNALSGGQLVRVGLAWATFPYPPHVLLLDEPTNHLDMNTIQLLGEALRKYQGAVVLISHDLHFLDILTNGSERGEEDGDKHVCGRVRAFEVSKKKGMVSLVPLDGVKAYQEKEESRMASLGRI